MIIFLKTLSHLLHNLYKALVIVYKDVKSHNLWAWEQEKLLEYDTQRFRGYIQSLEIKKTVNEDKTLN